MPLSEFIADCDDGQIVNADIAIVHAQLASKNLNYLCGNESICSKLTHHFAHNRNNSQFFITQFNQIVENYSLPKALLLDEI